MLELMRSPGEQSFGFWTMKIRTDDVMIDRTHPKIQPWLYKYDAYTEAAEAWNEWVLSDHTVDGGS